jgi:hypothetical protein
MVVCTSKCFPKGHVILGSRFALYHRIIKYNKVGHMEAARNLEQAKVLSPEDTVDADSNEAFPE